MSRLEPVDPATATGTTASGRMAGLDADELDASRWGHSADPKVAAALRFAAR